MSTFQNIRKYAPGMGWILAAAVLFIVGSSFALIAQYQTLYLFLENILTGGPLQGLANLVTVLVLWAFAYLATYFVALMATHLIAFRMEANLRKAGIDALLKAPFSFFDKYPSGKIRKILDDNAALTHTSVAHLLPDLAAAFWVPALALLLAFRVDWRLGLFMIATILIGFLIGKGMMGETNMMADYMKAQETMSANAVEYVRNIGVIKIFNANVESMKNFYDSIEVYANRVLSYSLSCCVPYVSFQTFFNSVFLLLIPMGFYFLSQGEDPMLYLSKAIFYVVYCGVLFSAFMKIMYVGMENYLANSSIEKVEGLIREMEEGKIQHGTREMAENQDIDFHDVSFAYGEETVLENLSLHLTGGKSYALVGSSGGGKSTIAKLIAGFYHPQQGEVCIGGHPLREYSEEALMRMMAMVFQDAKLFKTSIYDNVQIGNPEASREEVMEALRLARCDEILDRFPDREQTQIGAKGVHLSGGEKQRVAIARAILKDAPIIVLDEASAAADPENEYEIQQAFSNLMKGKTVIMIAHRLTSIRRVDEILVIDQGKLVERGSHTELMEQKGRYAHLQALYARANDWKVVA